MYYTIQDVAKCTNLSAHTLRYYDKLGLIPSLTRSSSGARLYTEADICWIQFICCLKNSGMTLNQIKEFMGFCLDQSKCEERKRLLESHRALILSQIQQLQDSLCLVDYKIEHYKEVGVFHINK